MWQSTRCPNLWLTESEPRDVVRIPFIENLDGACMCDDWPLLLGGSQMATLEAAICNALCERWSSVAPVTNSIYVWLTSGDSSFLSSSTFSMLHPFFNVALMFLRTSSSIWKSISVRLVKLDKIVGMYSFSSMINVDLPSFLIPNQAMWMELDTK